MLLVLNTKMRSIFLLSPLSVILLLPVLGLYFSLPTLSTSCLRSSPSCPIRHHRRVYELLSHLLLAFHSSCAQLALTSTFNQLAIVHTSLQSLASLLESLGACSTKQVKRTRFRSSTRGVRDAQRRALRYPISSRLAAGIVRCTTFYSRPGGTCHS